MNKFEALDAVRFRDTESNHKFAVWGMDAHNFVDFAKEVATGLNLVYTVKTRRGSIATMSEGEFDTFHAAMLEIDEKNQLVLDIIKLCDLVKANKEVISFAS